MIANVVSVRGRAKIIRGTISEISVCALNMPSTEITARVYPRNSAPVSPMKIFAGFLLKGRNPKQEPIRISVISADV